MAAAEIYTYLHTLSLHDARSILYASYGTVDRIKVRNNIGGHGPSTDGIDIDSSSWILVQNADIDCNDDNFCLKSGRDWDGLRINRPTEYVLIQNCIARREIGRASCRERVCQYV